MGCVPDADREGAKREPCCMVAEACRETEGLDWEATRSLAVTDTARADVVSFAVIFGSGFDVSFSLPLPRTGGGGGALVRWPLSDRALDVEAMAGSTADMGRLGMKRWPPLSFFSSLALSVGEGSRAGTRRAITVDPVVVVVVPADGMP